MPFFKRKRNAAAEENPSAIGEKKAIPRKKAAKGEFIEVATNNIKEIERIHIPFDELLSKVQQYMSTKYSVDLYRSDNRELMKQLIQQYMKDNNYYVPNMILKEVSDKLYTEMAEYSLLTQYLRNPHIEEININGWDDITVIPAHGERFKVDGYEDTYHVINSDIIEYEQVYLLESETRGEDAPHIVINAHGKVRADDMYSLKEYKQAIDNLEIEIER